MFWFAILIWPQLTPFYAGANQQYNLITEMTRNFSCNVRLQFKNECWNSNKNVCVLYDYILNYRTCNWRDLEIVAKNAITNCTDSVEQLLIGTFGGKQCIWLQGNACLIKRPCKVLVKLTSKMPITSRGICYIFILYR